jgi:hypothetical protein
MARCGERRPAPPWFDLFGQEGLAITRHLLELCLNSALKDTGAISRATNPAVAAFGSY